MARIQFDVFISYSSQDRAAADAVRDALEGRGWRCWMAPRNVDAGAEWAEAIEQAIRHTAVLVLIFSERSNASRHVRREVTLGDGCGCLLIPYRIGTAEPRGALRYFLCATHWLDAAAETNGRAVQQLCDAVGLELSRPVSPSPADAAPLSAADRSRVPDVERRLVDQMLAQQQVAVRLDGFSEAELRIIVQLEREGVLENKPSPFRPESRFIGPASPEQCDRLLRQWVAARANTASGEWLQCVARFPLLAGAIGKFLTDRSNSGDRLRLAEMVAAVDPEAEPILAAAAMHALESAKGWRELLALCIESGSYHAARGLASAAQQCLERHRGDAAQELLAAIHRWGQGRELNVDEVSFLVIEVANDQGRLWRRQGDLARAEQHFRQTLEIAKRSDDPVLTAIVAINLARCLLDDATPGRVEEAIALLRYAVDQLTDPSQERYLAAAFHNLGDAYAKVNPSEAESYFRRDVEICRRQNDPHDLTDALDRLGMFLADSGRHREALDVHREAERLFSRYGDPSRQARVLANLGRAHLGDARRTGNHADLLHARDVLLRSCQLFSSLDEPGLYAPALENLGRTQYLLGDEATGVATLNRSIAQYRRWSHRAGGEIAEEIQQELNALQGESA